MCVHVRVEAVVAINPFLADRPAGLCLGRVMVV